MCEFLNDVSRQFEDDFLRLDTKFERLETALHLLETKLSSIPDNCTKREENTSENKEAVNVESTSNVQNEQQDKKLLDKSENQAETSFVDPKYEKYVKMINMGVPSAAVEQKMNLEGIEQNIIKKILNKEAISQSTSAVRGEDQRSESSIGVESDGNDDSFSD
uniref:WASH complex subunit 3 n=1 Tax=Romanomermis culicivorax TaxID=13658 RepID=A0A915I843_ROMCU